MYGIFIYLHLVDFYGFHVGKYTSPMDPMGLGKYITPSSKTPMLEAEDRDTTGTT